jgi:hypothetical protein
MKRQTKRTRAVNRQDLPAEAFDLTPRVQVTLTDETCWITRFDERGLPSTTYPVPVEEVARAFNVFGAATGFLPPDTLYWERKGQSLRLAIWLPPAVRALTFGLGRREKTLHVPLPGFMFVGQGTNYWIHALPQRPTTGRERLYRAPLPNVHDDGHICAGSVKFPRCSPATIHAAADLFFESHFNLDLSQDKFLAEADDEDDLDPFQVAHGEADDEDDLDPFQVAHGERPPRTRTAGARRTLFHFLQSLDGRKEFPVDRLVPCTHRPFLGGPE